MEEPTVRTALTVATRSPLVAALNRCTAADGCREQPLLTVILQEGDAPAQGRGPNRNPSSSSKIAREPTPLHWFVTQRAYLQSARQNLLQLAFEGRHVDKILRKNRNQVDTVFLADPLLFFGSLLVFRVPLEAEVLNENTLDGEVSTVVSFWVSRLLFVEYPMCMEIIVDRFLAEGQAHMPILCQTLYASTCSSGVIV